QGGRQLRAAHAASVAGVLRRESATSREVPVHSYFRGPEWGADSAGGRYAHAMAHRRFLDWPVLRQLTSRDVLGRGPAVTSERTRELAPRTSTADRVVSSVCPFCAVGCGQRVYVKDEKVVQIEGDADSPISRGRLCPKGAASRQ